MRARVVPFLCLAILVEALLLLLVSLGDLADRVPETIGLLFLVSIFYLVSCYLVLKIAHDSKDLRISRLRGLIVLAAAGFRLTAWPLWPALSDDVFRYRWEGMVQARGGNPYQARPIDPEWAALRDETFERVSGKDFKTVYGPLIELVQQWTYSGVAALFEDPFRQAFWFKFPAALFDLGVIAALWALLATQGMPVERVLLYAWSPLPVIEFWGMGHNDSIVLLFILLALLAAAHGRWLWAFAALTGAAGAKIWPLALFPVFIGWKGFRPLRWRQWLAGLPVAGLLAWPYWSNVEENVRFGSGFLGGWRNNDSVYGLLLWITGDQYPAKYAAFAIVGATALLVTVQRWPLERACLWVVVAMLMVSSNCHPWYLTWIIPLLAFEPSAALLLWTSLAPLAYRVVIAWAALGEWEGNTPFRWFIYAPVYGIMAGAAMKWFFGRSRVGDAARPAAKVSVR